MQTKNRFVPKIGNEETAALPAVEFGGAICVVDREEQVAAACEELMRQPMIGFDTETRPSFRPGVMYRVALLQLSAPERCYLFRLNRIALSKPLLQLLESPEVLKIGADVAGDLRSLRQLRRFRDGGFVDLQTLAPAWGIEEKSLRKLSAIVLGKRVSKAQRLSNWEAATLTSKQQLYAATDAWVCTEIYRRLLDTPKAAVPAGPAPVAVSADNAAPAGAEPSDPAASARSGRRASRRRRSGVARRRSRTPETGPTAAAADSDERKRQER